MRSPEDILDDILAGGVGTTEEVRAEAIAVIEQAQREAIEECAVLVDETAADVKSGLKNRLRDPAGMMISLADDIRALDPRREGQ